MPFRSLAEFLEDLEGRGQLVRLTGEVDPNHELAAITESVSTQYGPALLFQHLRGHHTAVATNVLGSEARICRALGAESIAEACDRLAPGGSGGRRGWLQRWTGNPDDRWQPRTVKSAACQQVVKLASDVDLGELPLPRFYTEDAGASLTALVVSQADDGPCHVGSYVVQQVDRTRLAISLKIQDPLAADLAEQARRGQPLHVAILPGVEPSLTIAVNPLVGEVDPWILAAMLRGKPIDTIKCRSCELQIPAEAEMVLEGRIDPTQPPVTLGPLGNAAGFYSPAVAMPAIDIVAITHRVNPILAAALVGPDSAETAALDSACERLYLPAVQAVAPEITDLHLPSWAGPDGMMIAAIRKTHVRQPHRVAAALWGWQPLSMRKLLVVVDEDAAIRDIRQVLRWVAAYSDMNRDVGVYPGPASPLDHATPLPLSGHHLFIDATAKLPGEHSGHWPDAAGFDPSLLSSIARRWKSMGLPGTPPSSGG